MNWKFWKHKEKNEIISKECHSKLPENQRSFYVGTDDYPTHKVVQTLEDDENDSLFVTSVLFESELLSDNNSDSNINYGSSDDSFSTFGGFDGGDSGGGGAGGDW